MFDDVLPSIRRHGMYAIDELLSDDEFLERAIATLRAERAKRLAAKNFSGARATRSVSYWPAFGSSHCTGRRIRPRALPW